VKRRAVAMLAICACCVLATIPARAALHEVSVGNYYYQDDATGARKLEVREGDQIRFTIRQADYPPHSINVKELGIHSGDLLVFQTYTTPPLKKTGTFVLYCTAHRDRGHWTTLKVLAKPISSPKPAATTRPTQRTSTPAPARAKTSASPTASSKAKAAPRVVKSAETVVPSGIGVTKDRRKAPPGPNSVQALLGRDFSGPWTRALVLALLAGLPIAVVTFFALRKQFVRDRAGSLAIVLQQQSAAAPQEKPSQRPRAQPHGSRARPKAHARQKGRAKT
jgi:plastocyanin